MKLNCIIIISQILGFIAFIFSLNAYHQKSKKNILINMILSSSLKLMHYFLLGAINGCITKLIAVIRDIFIIKKENNKKISSKYFILLFIILYVLSGVIFYKNIISIFPTIASIIYLVLIWNGDESAVKKAALSCYFFWLIYNIFVISLSGIFSNLISIISTFIAVKKVKKK